MIVDKDNNYDNGNNDEPDPSTTLILKNWESTNQRILDRKKKIQALQQQIRRLKRKIRSQEDSVKFFKRKYALTNNADVD